MNHHENKTEDFSSNLISTYSQEQAISDGVLMEVGRLTNGKRIVFTGHLFDSGGYEDMTRLLRLIEIGMSMLKKPDPEDTDSMRLRVIEKDRIWVIWNEEGITFLRPEDY